MNFRFQVLTRFITSILVSFLFIPALFAQKSAESGASTKPYTVVYKLKKTSENSNARIAKPGTLQNTLQKIGAKDHKQKFPNLAGSATSRASNPHDLSLIYELQYSPEKPFEQVKRELMATGLVAYVEPLYQRELFHQSNDPDADSTKTTQYYLKLIQAYAGWETEKGDATVVIGVLDTGYSLTHPDLKDKIHVNELDPVDGIDNDKDGYVDNYMGWNFAENNNNTSDNLASGAGKGHGTAVAGVAAANTNNGFGMAGVGYNVKFMPLKIFNSLGVFIDGYSAIVYAAEKGCKVINLSWGGTGHSQFEQDVINYVVLEKNVVVVASAGNSNGNKRLNYYPASYENVISVGGTDQQDVKLTNYTYSYQMDVTAPSRAVYSTFNNSFTTISGTSFGAPMVAATAALVRSKFPHLNALAVMERIRASSDNIYHLTGNQPYQDMLGRGRLNVKRALRETNLKSVRSISFKTEFEGPLQSGQTTNIFATFTNYLSSLQNLQVTLTSPSPYVTITNQNLTIGGMATSATANNSQAPFKVTVSPDAPAHTLIPFRIGFTDGNYTDFQYYELLINPDFITLTTDKLKVSFNGKGNIGYNGFESSEGKGFTYNGSSSLIYEGGLIVAAGPDRVSDNLRNDYWRSDDDFTPFSRPKVLYHTTLADQVVMGAMRDKYPTKENAGVEVKHRSYSWNTAGNQAFVVVEYQIKNITSEVIPSLHAGLFADWDIGTYYQNAADWDETRHLGYAYSKTSAMPYTGIKLLSKDEPSYSAIESGGEYIEIEDGFSDAEKYAALANGVKYSKAGQSKTGGNIAHVVGAVAKNLAPGQVKTIAFAILAGEDLAALQKNADAAQLKYISIKSGPAPLAVKDTICVGSTVSWTPDGGNRFKFYADAEKKELLSTGRSFSMTQFLKNSTVYAANADSLFESPVSSATYSSPLTPELDFAFSVAPVYPGQPVSFQSQSKHSKNFTWKFTDAGSKIFYGNNVIYAFTAPGTYEATLTATDSRGCVTSSITKQIKVLHATSEVLEAALTFYPNPAHKSVSLQMLPDGNINQIPEIILVDVMGKQIKPKVEAKNSMLAIISLEGLAPGIYHAYITYSNNRFIRRVVVL